jgi:hypothetical protein
VSGANGANDCWQVALAHSTGGSFGDVTEREREMSAVRGDALIVSDASGVQISTAVHCTINRVLPLIGTAVLK